MSSAPQSVNTVPGSSTSTSHALVVRDPNQPIQRRRNEFQLLLVDWEKMSLWKNAHDVRRNPHQRLLGHVVVDNRRVSCRIQHRRWSTHRRLTYGDK